MIAGKGDSEGGAASRNQGLTAPAVSLPKGGGALRGIGEKFSANPVTGTGTLTIPIVTSPGRTDFGPRLALSYDSGSGNGPFGLGWSLPLPAITRKTEQGLPRYLDSAPAGNPDAADGAPAADVFILSDFEDLVPVLDGEDGGRAGAGVGAGGASLTPAPLPEGEGRTADPGGAGVGGGGGACAPWPGGEGRADGYRVERYRPGSRGSSPASSAGPAPTGRCTGAASPGTTC